MTMDIHSHDDFQDELVEFALGILDGRARAALVDHVANCPDCTERLQELSATADLLMYIPVGVEPPLGFESGIIERIRQSQPLPSRWRPRGWQLLAAAAAVVAVSFGLGWTVDHAVAKPTTPVQAAGAMKQHVLEANGHDVGTVYAYSGSPAWMFVTVDATGAPATVRCTIITTSGTHRFIGTFALASGRGSWGASLPVSFKSVRNVVLSSNSGTVVAQFDDSTWNYPTGRAN
ncbi:MAG TPA: zf-HC2 domain-containing protein [Acidimicrobiales bacterium]